MKTKIIEEPVYKTTKVLTGTKTRTVYIAEDGQEFDAQSLCENHNKQLDITKKGEAVLSKMAFSDEDLTCTLLFGWHDTDTINFYKWIATNDAAVHKDIVEYLNRGMRKNSSKLFPSHLLEGYTEGEVVIIATWVDGADSDYWSHQYRSIRRSEAMDKIDYAINQLKSIL